jgi:cupin 2 domain-containing protein
MIKNFFWVDEVQHLREELFEEILRTDDLLIERIVSTGQATPEGEWYDQATDEWVILVQGKARLRFEHGEVIDLSAGDYLLIPAHRRHRVEHTSSHPPCLWLAVHGRLNPST